MAKTPIEMMLDGATWTPIEDNTSGDDDLPFATHSGVLTIGEFTLRCYQLNTGQRVFDIEDVKKFFNGISTGGE
jgi:hypothetical protein